MQEFSSVIASSYDAESLAPMLTEKASEGWSVVSIVSAGTNVVAYLTRGGAAAAPAEAPSAEVADAPAAEEPAADEVVDTSFDAMLTQTDDDSTAVAAAATAISPTLPGESVGTVAEPEPEETFDAGANEEAAAAVAAADEPAGWGAAPADDAGQTAESSEPSVADLAAQIGGDDTTTVPEPAEAPAEEPAPAQEPAAAEPAAAEPAAEPAAAAADSAVPAGWYADPSGRFELRYWDGQAWTEHVSRAGQQYTDPPVA